MQQFYKDPEALLPHLRHEMVLSSYLFKAGSTGTIFSYPAIEAVLNQLIPDDYTVDYKKKHRDKENIQRYLGLQDKLEIISQIAKKGFSKKHPAKFRTILNLKLLRDELVHLKIIKVDKLHTTIKYTRISWTCR